MKHWVIDTEHNVREAASWQEYLAFVRDIEDLAEFNRLCRVAHTQVDTDCFVSTVFLRGIDHSHSLDPDHEPLLFETMVFRAGESAEQWRYSTWDQAVTGHAEAVALVLGTPVP